MNSAESLDDVINWLGQVSKTLNYLLYHLDENNVTRAQSVVADWVYAGNIQAAQIDVAMGKISTAQIEELIVGDNVIMGPNATISWGKVFDIPTDLVYQGDLEGALAWYVTTGQLTEELADYLTTGHFYTLMGTDYIVTGRILANQIDAGTLTGFTIRTAASGNRMVFDGQGLKSYNSYNQLEGFQAGTHIGFDKIGMYVDGSEYFAIEVNDYLDSVHFLVHGQPILNYDADYRIAYPQDDWDFGYANVSGITWSEIDQGTNPFYGWDPSDFVRRGSDDYVHVMGRKRVEFQFFEGAEENFFEVYVNDDYKGSFALY